MVPQDSFSRASLEIRIKPSLFDYTFFYTIKPNSKNKTLV
jgi:hypothetical protein